MWWLLVVELGAAVWLWRLNWRCGVREGGRFRNLMAPDLGACAFILPFFLKWVPGRWGIFLGQLPAILLLTRSVKILRLHYGLPWGRAKSEHRQKQSAPEERTASGGPPFRGHGVPPPKGSGAIFFAPATAGGA